MKQSKSDLNKLNDSKRERRRKKRLQDNLTNQRCFKCRKMGHRLINCPSVCENSESFNICFKCGSTEHTSQNCKSLKKCERENYPYAKCFICDEKGHISKNCSKNSNGIYPNGGSCVYCGKNDHLRRDCPKTNIEFSNSHEHIMPKLKQTLKLKKKIIRF